MSSVNDIRTAFLEFFGANGHAIVSSSPLVPQNDPTLMFTNAGMVQFKNLFTGLETRDYNRAVAIPGCHAAPPESAAGQQASARVRIIDDRRTG